MEKKNILMHKGYYTKIEYSAEDSLLWGKIEGINDLVLFESGDPNLIKQEFIQAVDEYLSFCDENNLIPEKPYKGSFNIRIAPQLHKSLALYSFQNDISINASVEKAIRELLAPKRTMNTVDGWMKRSNIISSTAISLQSYCGPQSNITVAQI